MGRSGAELPGRGPRPRRYNCLVLSRLLDATAERHLAETRGVLTELRDLLIRAPATDEDASTLRAAVAQLDDVFLLVVVGEFNAGKRAFVTALAGARLLDEGVTPTTSCVHLLRYGEQAAQENLPSGIRVVSAPLDLLRDVHIVDTPGTNAIIREHEQITAGFVPRSDLVLFVTSSDRPFTETERAFLETIRDWGKKIVLVVNKIDIFDRPEQLEEVVGFVREAATRLLGVTPEIFPVSARAAWRAKHGEPSAWATSGFEPLERFIHDTLDESGRFQLKLANPLGVGDALARRYASVADERVSLLADDVAAMEDVERQLAGYRDDLQRGFELRMTGIEKVLLEMEARGHQYFEDTLRIARVLDLLNRARIQREFEERVVGDAPQQVERRVADLIDWLVEQDFAQWRAVTERLAARRREYGDRVLGAGEMGTFTVDRARLLDSVGREAQRVVDTYDRRRESQAIADAARLSVAATAAVGAGALGLGAIVAVAATTAAADVTGILMASVVAAVGFLILPARRRRARTELRDKMAGLRERLVSALRTEFERAQERSAARLSDAIAPYSRFVRTERSRWTDLRGSLTAIRGRINSLSASIRAAN
jgi:signal recognition particle receptor subunit beta